MPPKLDLLFVEADEIVPSRAFDRRGGRSERLHPHLAFDLPAPGATGDLSQQLECSLTRAKIRLMQREVGVNDSHQCDIWEMQSFGDHLRAEQDVELPRTKISQNPPKIIFPFQSVRIH